MVNISTLYFQLDIGEIVLCKEQSSDPIVRCLVWRRYMDAVQSSLEQASRECFKSLSYIADDSVILWFHPFPLPVAIVR
jgi:hypothetical protein